MFLQSGAFLLGACGRQGGCVGIEPPVPVLLFFVQAHQSGRDLDAKPCRALLEALWRTGPLRAQRLFERQHLQMPYQLGAACTQRLGKIGFELCKRALPSFGLEIGVSQQFQPCEQVGIELLLVREQCRRDACPGAPSMSAPARRWLRRRPARSAALPVRWIA